MTDLDGYDMVVAARAIATIAHRGQTDKGGNPYIDHPRRVAARMDTHAERAVAWLHDVLEDTDLTRDDLHDAGIPWYVIGDVELLTRSQEQRVEEYYEQLAGTARARRVKLADIADNTDPDRLALIEDDATVARLVRKYAKARLLLGATSG